ncbi:protein ESMERALDA 1 [Citrus sinensis]|nr:protein ESMERALDA 1 [Citrus sinensis]
MRINRLPSSGHTTPSPPASPRRSPRYRHGRGKPGGRFTPVGPPGRANLAHRLAWLFLSVLLRRQGIFLFAPLIYISGMLLYMGTVSFDVVPVIKHRPAPGSVYRSPQVYAKLKPEMDADNSSSDAICNAVAVAGYLNATLVIPNFHYHSIWRDPRCVSSSGSLTFYCRTSIPYCNVIICLLSMGYNEGIVSLIHVKLTHLGAKFNGFCCKFRDIYDEDYFTSVLQNDVRVVNKIPEYIMERFDHNMSNVYNFRVKAWSPIQFYKDEVLPKLLEERLIRISPFANRLSFDAPPAVQRLRCLANYEALRFSSPILTMGETLVARMKERSVNHGGKYISVHLRFEEDMVAFSCCVFDGGEREKEDMKEARERGWKGKFTKPGRVIRPGAIRINGKCPLTPLEVGLMLRGMGFDKNTYIFLASGKIYNAEKTMAPLLEMFPNLQTKEMLASEEELSPFKNFSSRMAAVDYTVCLHSEVFVTTQGGNFPHFLMGHRRYLYGGHSKTIRPDKRKLALLFDNPNIGWRSFKRQMLSMRSHSDSKGYELKRPSDSPYTFPCPDCMCRANKSNAT